MALIDCDDAKVPPEASPIPMLWQHSGVNHIRVAYNHIGLGSDCRPQIHWRIAIEDECAHGSNAPSSCELCQPSELVLGKSFCRKQEKHRGGFSSGVACEKM
jgi:hypothetical protein